MVEVMKKSDPTMNSHLLSSAMTEVDQFTSGHWLAIMPEECA